MPPKPHLRVVYDDLERLRADVRALLDQGAYIIDWLHIWERGHDIDEPQVSRALRAGEYCESRFRGRYLAEYEEHDEREIRVVFEVWAEASGQRLVVVTAYPLEDL